MYRGFVWQADTPEHRVSGQLDFTGPDLPRLDVTPPIFEGRVYRQYASPTGDDERSVRRSPRFGRRLPAQNYPRRAERRLGDIRDRRARTSLDFESVSSFDAVAS